jgi:uncharacterized protein YutE (UPF0331/DUF86 family)
MADEFDDIDNIEDGFDDDFDFDSEAGDVSSGRTVTDQIVADTKQSFIDDFKDTSKVTQVGEVLEGGLKGIAGERAASEILDGVKAAGDEISGAVDDLKKASSPLVKTLKSKFPEDGFVGGLLTKIDDMVSDTPSDRAKTPDEIAAAEANSNVIKVLGEQISLEDRQAKIQTAITARGNTSRDDLLREIAVYSKNTLFFHDTNTNNYYRKSLELKYKAIYEQKKLFALHVKSYDSFKNQLEGIVKNTALPEFVKIRKTEALRSSIRQNMSNELYNSLAKNNTWATNVRDNVRTRVRGITEGISAGMLGANELVEQAGDIDQDMIGMMGGGLAASGFRGMLGRTLGRITRRTKRGRGLEQTLQQLAIDPGSVLSEQAAKRGGILGKALNSVADLTAVHDKYEAFDAYSENLGDSAYLDIRTKRSINEIIPGYLAKILSAVNKSPEERYDFKTGKFVSRDTAKKEFKSELDLGQADNFATKIERSVSNLEKMSSVELSKTERRRLAQRLLSFGIKGTDLTPRNLEKVGFYDGLSPKLNMKFRSLFSNASKDSEGNEDYEKLTSVTKLLKDNKQFNYSTNKKVKELIDKGFREELTEYGVLRYDRVRGTYIIDANKYREFVKKNVAKRLYKDKDRLSIDDLTAQERLKRDVSNRVSTTKRNILARTEGFLARGIDSTFDTAGSFKSKFFKRFKSSPEEALIDNLEKANKTQAKLAEELKAMNKPKYGKYDKDKDGDRDGGYLDRMELFAKKKVDKEKAVQNKEKDDRGFFAGIAGKLLTSVSGLAGKLVGGITGLFGMGGIAASMLGRVLGTVVGTPLLGLAGLAKTGFGLVASSIVSLSRQLLLGNFGGSLKGIWGGTKNLMRKLGGFASKFKIPLLAGAALGGTALFADDAPNIDFPTDGDLPTNQDATGMSTEDMVNVGLGGASLYGLTRGKKTPVSKTTGLLEKSKKLLTDAFKTISNSKVGKTAEGLLGSKGGKILKVVAKKNPISRVLSTVYEVTKKLMSGKTLGAAKSLGTGLLEAIPVIGLASMAYEVAEASDSEETKDSKSDFKKEVVDMNTPKFKRVKASTSTTTSRPDKLLLERIAKGETYTGMKGYNTSYNYGKWIPKGTPKLTELTIRDIFKLQSVMVRKQEAIGKRHTSSAVGKYQFIEKTLRDVVKQTKTPLDAVFTPELQDQLILYRLHRTRGYGKWKTQVLSDEDFIFNLSKEFASIATTKSFRRRNKLIKRGDSYYGQGVHTTIEDMKKTFRAMRRAMGVPVEDTTKHATPESKTDTVVKADGKLGSIAAEGLSASITALFKYLGVTQTPKKDKDLDDGTPVINDGLSPEDMRTISATTPIKKNATNAPITVGGMCGIPHKIKSMPSVRKKTGGRKITPKYIVLHNTAGSSLYLDRLKNSGVGTQLWIDKDGTLVRVNDVDDLVWHVGPTSNLKGGASQPVRSSNSIGIEMVCAYNKKTKKWDPLTKAQKATLRKTVACLMREYGIPADHIVHHFQVAKKTPGEGKEAHDVIKAMLSGSGVELTIEETPDGKPLLNPLSKEKGLNLPNTKRVKAKDLGDGTPVINDGLTKEDLSIFNNTTTVDDTVSKIRTNKKTTRPSDIDNNVTPISVTGGKKDYIDMTASNNRREKALLNIHAELKESNALNKKLIETIGNTKIEIHQDGKKVREEKVQTGTSKIKLDKPSMAMK